MAEMKKDDTRFYLPVVADRGSKSSALADAFGGKPYNDGTAFILAYIDPNNADLTFYAPCNSKSIEESAQKGWPFDSFLFTDSACRGAFRTLYVNDTCDLLQRRAVGIESCARHIALGEDLDQDDV